VGITAGQEKYQEEKTCDKRHPYRIIIIIIIIIINPPVANGHVVAKRHIQSGISGGVKT